MSISERPTCSSRWLLSVRLKATEDIEIIDDLGRWGIGGDFTIGGRTI